MIQHLSIENYALISHLELPFGEGFSAITGETGAGKSILLGALALILGQRADTGVLYDAQKKCVVEGTFAIGDYNLEHFFEQHDLDYDPTLLLRREINKQGKSRAFINDTPVKLTQMKELGSRLVDIHSQNKTLTLNNSDVQLAVIDTVAGEKEMLSNYREKYRNLKHLQEQYQEMVEKEKQTKADLDYYQYLFNELEDAALGEEEQQQLEEDLAIQNHAETIKSALTHGAYHLSGDENSIITQLQQVHAELRNSAEHHKKLQTLEQRMDSATIELEDIAGEMSTLSEEISYDPEHIETLNKRLSLIYELQQKHRVNTVTALLEKKEWLEQQLNSASDLEADIASLEKSINRLSEELHNIAGKLSEKRKHQLPRIEKDIMDVLKQLGMPDAVFRIAHQQLEDLTPDGKDRFVFRFSANQGVEPQPIAKIASGGELSRLMLSVKSLIARKTLLPTIIFDEIDSGVSGDIAGKTGAIMKKMAQGVQVIAITHLPQIAGKSHDHLFAYKTVDNGKTFSNIKRLNDQERVEELAKMLSDNQVTTAALTAAKELMNSQ